MSTDTPAPDQPDDRPEPQGPAHDQDAEPPTPDGEEPDTDQLSPDSEPASHPDPAPGASADASDA